MAAASRLPGVWVIAPAVFSVTVLPASVPAVAPEPMARLPPPPVSVIVSGAALGAAGVSGSEASPARTVPVNVRPAVGASTRVKALRDK